MLRCLRHQIKKAVGNEKSEINEKVSIHWRKKYAGIEIDEYLERKDQVEKRFERDLAVMIGCVCYRALSGLNGEGDLDSKEKRNQIIVSKNLAQRLTNPTFFEIVGWKRMDFFPNALEQFGFDPDLAELKFEEVELAISIGNGQINDFQLGSNFAYKSHGTTFLDALNDK